MLANILQILVCVSVLGRKSNVEAQYSSGSGCTNAALPSLLRVTAIPSAFLIAANSSTGTQNSGFFVDFLNAIQGITGIPYTLTIFPSFNYNDKDASGSYNGSLLGTLLNNNADLIGADIYILQELEAIVDFLVPIGTTTFEVFTNAQGLQNGVQYLTPYQDNIDIICQSKNASVQAICSSLKAGLPNSIGATDAAAIAKVLSGNFAYIQSPVLISPFIAQNPGKIIDAGHLLSIPLGYAVQQGSPLREKLNSAILQLTQDGTLQSLLDKNKVTITTP